MNLRDTILAASDIEKKVITVKQWGGVKIELRGISGEERNKVYGETRKGEEIDFDELQYALIIASAYDPESGEKIFKPEDAAVLKTKSWTVINRLSGIIMKLSGIGAGDSEDAEKN